jgi:23S rRNA pseudouridine1911/1915/1917 synthase
MNNNNEDNFLDEEDDEQHLQELFEHFAIIVDKGQELLRIDKFLLNRFSKISRNKIQNSIDAGFIKVNGRDIKANYKVKPLDDIRISFPKPPRNGDIIPENIPLTIVYEDNEMLIINKQAGMVVHPAYNNWNGTLLNALAYRFDNLPKNTDERLGLVHRIDKDTSGLLVIAKTDESLTYLCKQFFDHTIERTYYALVWGVPKEKKGTINVHIGRSMKDRRVMIAYPTSEYGKHAITHYEILETFGDYVSLIKCNLETGRTHQIRAHFKYIGHPLFGDMTYGGDKILRGQQTAKYVQFVENCFKILPRQALHAKSLGVIHPTSKEFVQFNSEIPEDLKEVIEKWRNYV